MKEQRSYLCIPMLILQPTWGGDYIAKHKGWQNDPRLLQKRIGQSYELSPQTLVANTIKDSRHVEFHGQIRQDDGDQNLFNDKLETVALKDLIAKDPEHYLGKKAISRHGPNMKLLLKMTQAQGNSFQLHVKPDTVHPKWEPKPESWVYFEPGKITYGVKKDVELSAYKLAMHKINRRAVQLSKKVQWGEFNLDNALQELHDFIAKVDPYQYVNVHEVEADAVIDLSHCGVHHSWEEDVKYPQGNILYEIQLNVDDSESSIRSFDKGKMKADGSIRQVHIDDYFEHLDMSARSNDLRFAKQTPKLIWEDHMNSVFELLNNRHYAMRKITASLPIPLEFSQTDDSFHHLFLKTGMANVVVLDAKSGHKVEHILTVSAGHSAIVPAGVKQFLIQPLGQCEIYDSYIA